jgi:hypothetical protein
MANAINSNSPKDRTLPQEAFPSPKSLAFVPPPVTAPVQPVPTGTGGVPVSIEVNFSNELRNTFGSLSISKSDRYKKTIHERFSTLGMDTQKAWKTLDGIVQTLPQEKRVAYLSDFVDFLKGSPRSNEIQNWFDTAHISESQLTTSRNLEGIRESNSGTAPSKTGRPVDVFSTNGVPTAISTPPEGQFPQGNQVGALPDHKADPVPVPVPQTDTDGGAARIGGGNNTCAPAGNQQVINIKNQSDLPESITQTNDYKTNKHGFTTAILDLISAVSANHRANLTFNGRVLQLTSPTNIDVVDLKLPVTTYDSQRPGRMCMTVPISTPQNADQDLKKLVSKIEKETLFIRMNRP